MRIKGTAVTLTPLGRQGESVARLQASLSLFGFRIQIDVFGSQNHCGYRQKKKGFLHGIAERIDNLIIFDTEGDKRQSGIG